MNTKNKLENGLKDAMRSGDDLRKQTLRMAISAIRLAEVEKGASLEDHTIISILQKEIKSHQESLEEAQRANRDDLADIARQRIAVLNEYLPAQLSADELEALVRQVIEEVGASSMKEMGLVMKTLTPRLQGRASGEQANQVVRRLLS